MKNILLTIGLAGFALLCFVALSVPAIPQADEILGIQNVGPDPRTPLMLTPGQRTRISVTVDYLLSSADRASLSIFAEEYPEAAGGCLGNVHMTDGASYLAIQRGKGTATLTVIWPANPAGDPMPVYPEGYLALGAGLWTPDQASLIRSLGIFRKICYHFAPGGGLAPSQAGPVPKGGNAPQAGNVPPVPKSPFPPFYRWQLARNGSVPPGAVIGGYSSVQSHPGSNAVSYGTPYYVCRAAFQQGVFPGKVVGNNCNFSAGVGREILASTYEVLTSESGQFSLNWQMSGARPPDAVAGGRLGQDLYLCQLPYQGGLHPGWVNTAQNGYVCSIGYGGREVDLPGFSYLVPMRGLRID